MAQVTYRGNLAAKVFPFLSSQFGRTVIVPGNDQVNSLQTLGEAAGGDNNLPQAYYMHNVVPTAQGYKSVGYKNILPDAGVDFDRVIPIRDPSMVRGWLGLTLSGRVYIYRAGDVAWTDISDLTGGWNGASASVAYASGYTYLCLAGSNVYKLDVASRTLAPVVFQGVDVSGIVAITSSANYLIITDGVTVYWSSTISPEDFVPSQITGAGSGKPEDVEGRIVALVPLSNGFAVYTSVNIVIATYSQNARFPWIFRGADNSKGVSNIQHITYSSDDGTNYAWTSAGLQKISVTGAVTYLPEVTDFLAGQEFEDWDDETSSIVSQVTAYPMKIKLAFVGGRYLILSYGITKLTHALVYDTSLRRWGKLKLSHTACFDVSLNTDYSATTNTAASAKKTIGFVDTTGTVVICDFTNNIQAKDSLIILGKFQLIRTRLTTFQKFSVECVNTDANDNFAVQVATTLDGKNTDILTVPALVRSTPSYKEYASRVSGINHSLIFKGTFSLNSFELCLILNGRR